MSRVTIGEIGDPRAPETVLADYRMLTLAIEPPLTAREFGDWIAATFEDEGPACLWGNPIWLDRTKAHVYGLDLATYKLLHMEFKPGRFLLIAPRDGDAILPGVAGRIVDSLAGVPAGEPGEGQG